MMNLSRLAQFDLHFNKVIPCVLLEMDFSIKYRNKVTR